MPRRRVRTTDKAQWTSEQLAGALADINKGISVREAARKHSIPFSTLQKRNKSGSNGAPHLGCKTVFTPSQEQEIADHVKKLAKMYYGITPLQLRKLVFEFAEKLSFSHKFNLESKLAGRDWPEGFLKRNPSVSIRKPEGTSLNRIKSFNKTEVALFFKNLENLQEKYKFSPHKIFNMDETGFSTVPDTQKIIAPKGQKRIGVATSGERGANTTVICCMNAAGGFIPPLFIFARSRMAPSLSSNGPPGALYTCSKNGWSNEEIFVDWLKHFKSHCRPTSEEPVLLILDNHGSHITLEAYNYCRENNIIMLSLPPHSSHRLQPLDVVFFGPLKYAFSREVTLEMKNKPGERITVYHIAMLFNRAYSMVATISKGLSGFSSTGIYPINPNVFSDVDFPLDEEVLQTPNNDLPEVCSPSTSNDAVSFSEISPFPSTSAGARKENPRKQHSTILTETPQKEVLETKTAKRIKRETKKKETARKSLFIEPNLKTKKRKQKIDKLSSSESEVEEPTQLCLESSEDENWQPASLTDSESECPSNKELKVHKDGEDLNVGDFILVTVSNEKLKKDFVAQITQKSKVYFYIKFLRKYRGKADTYIFPEIDDVSVVTREEIIGKLTIREKLRYGRVKFA